MMNGKNEMTVKKGAKHESLDAVSSLLRKRQRG